MEKKKWRSPQALIVIAIIAVIFAYIFVDVFVTKPQIKIDLNDVKGQYIELSEFLDKKIPIIDSTFKEHAIQLNDQKSQIDTLQQTFKEINEVE